MDETSLQTNALYDPDEQVDRLIVWKAQQRIQELGEREMNVANCTSEELRARNRIYERASRRYFKPDRPRIPPWYRLTSEERDRLEHVDHFLVERARQRVAAQGDDPDRLWISNTTPDEMDAIHRLDYRARDRRIERQTKDRQEDWAWPDKLGLALFGLYVLGGIAFTFVVAPAVAAVIFGPFIVSGLISLAAEIAERSKERPADYWRIETVEEFIQRYRPLMNQTAPESSRESASSQSQSLD